MRGFTYTDSSGRTITVLGDDPLFPNGKRVLVGREDGVIWGVSAATIAELIAPKIQSVLIVARRRHPRPLVALLEEKEQRR